MHWELFLTRSKLLRDAMKSQMFGKFYQRKKERKEVFLIKTVKQNLQASETVMLSHNKLIYFTYYQQIPRETMELWLLFLGGNMVTIRRR